MNIIAKVKQIQKNISKKLKIRFKLRDVIVCVTLSQKQIIFLVTAEFGSHHFGGGLHENVIKVAGVFGTDVPTTHTTDTAFFIGLAGVSFVDRSHRTTGSTNAAIIASIIGFRLERNVGKFLVCAMTSGKVQLSENTAIEFGRNFAGKFDQFLVIISSNPIGKEGRQKNQTGLNFGEIR